MIGKIIRRQFYIFVALLFAITSLFLVIFSSKLVFAKPVEKIDELISFQTKTTFSKYLNDTKGNVKEKDLGKVEMKKVVGKNLYNIYVTYEGETKLIKEQEIPYVGKDGQNNPMYPERIYGLYYTSILGEYKVVDSEEGKVKEISKKTYPYIAYTIVKDVKPKELKNDFNSGEYDSFMSWTFWNLRNGSNYTQDKIKYFGYVSEEKVEKNYKRADVYDLKKNDPVLFDELSKYAKAPLEEKKAKWTTEAIKYLQEKYNFWFNDVKTEKKDYFLNLATPYPLKNLLSINFKYDMEKLAARKDPNNPDSEYLNPNIKDTIEKEKRYSRFSNKKQISRPPEYSDEFVNLSYSPLIDEGKKQFNKGDVIVAENEGMANFIAFFDRLGWFKNNHWARKIREAEKIKKAGLALIEQGEKSILISKIHNMAIKQGKLNREIAEIEKVVVDSNGKIDFMVAQGKEWERENKRIGGGLDPRLNLYDYADTSEGVRKVFGFNNHYFKIYLDTLTSYDYIGYKYRNLKVIEMQYEIFGRNYTVKAENNIDTGGVIDYNKDPENWNLDPNYKENKRVADESKKEIEEADKNIKKIDDEIKARARKRRIRRIIFLVLGSGVALAVIPIFFKIIFRRR